MTKLTSLLAAALLLAAPLPVATAGAADHDTVRPDTGNTERQSPRSDGASAARPLNAPQFVSTIATAPLALLDGTDGKTKDTRLFYMIGFSMALDQSCDFLSGYAVRQLGFTLSPVTADAVRRGVTERTGQLLRSAAAGRQDAQALHGQFGCSGEPLQKVLKGLSALWDSV